jgi:hypothetical protein
MGVYPYFRWEDGDVGLFQIWETSGEMIIPTANVDQIVLLTENQLASIGLWKRLSIF